MNKGKMEPKQETDPAPEMVRWFRDITKEHIPHVGGKGANLGEVYGRFTVPEGFCITVSAYKHFMDKTGIRENIHALLDKLDVEDTGQLEQVSKKIREIMLNQEFPGELKKEILLNYRQLKNRKVAVRSSATAEDLPGASFAGQQDTFLNKEGDDDVIKAVHKCWASLFTARAIYYREKNNFKHKDVFISVVVQEMVDPEYAGVMFTVDPIHKKHILIEVVKGLGEKLVSGQVTPNTYFMNKETHAIEEASEQFSLNQEMVREVSRIGEKIESHYNKPQDVEFAVKEGKIFILQSRPITTL